jgi:non-specific serine/threonine protein kinase
MAKRKKTEPPSSVAAEPAEPPNTESVQNRRWAWGMVFVLAVAVSGLWAKRHSVPAPSGDQPLGLAVAASSAAQGKASAPARSSAKSAAASKVQAETDAPAAVQDPASKPRKRGANYAADTSEPLNPRQACGSRTFISLAICMKRHCSRPAYAGHAECRRMTEQEQQNQRGFP